MLEPDQTTRVPPEPAVAGRPLDGPHTLQILSTEHWSLLAARSLGYTEAMSRASIFVASLTGSVVALALVGQASSFGSAFNAFALVLLPVVFLLGLSTIARLSQVNYEDAVWVQGMNRIRNAYLELAPELEPYFVTSRYDDSRGILQSALGVQGPLPAAQAFVSIPGVVAVVDAVVGAATGAIAARSLGLGLVGALVVAAVVFVLIAVLFALVAEREISRYERQFVTRFPSPVTDGGTAEG